MKVLLIEDDADVSAFIQREMLSLGHDIVVASDGLNGKALALEQDDIDVIVLDRMLPGIDGLRLLDEIRKRGCATPVLILSALGEVNDRVAGLTAGGDDYLSKPFAISELNARICALHRRAQQVSESITILRHGSVQLDLIARRAERDGQVLDLQPREFKLLEYFMRNAGQVVTRSMLLEHVWGYRFDPQTNVVDVHVSRLRSKLDKGFDQQVLLTVRGEGYRFDAST